MAQSAETECSVLEKYPFLVNLLANLDPTLQFEMHNHVIYVSVRPESRGEDEEYAFEAIRMVIEILMSEGALFEPLYQKNRIPDAVRIHTHPLRELEESD